MSDAMFDFSLCFNKAFEAYKNNFAIVLGASTVAALLSAISLGILAGPVTAGLFVLMLKLIDGKEGARFEDIFSRFDIFLPTFLLYLIWGAVVFIISLILSLIPFLGAVVSMVVSFAFSIFLMFAIMLVAEKGLNFKQSSIVAYGMLKKDLWPLIGFSAVASILGSVGVLACLIGAFFTMPIYYLMMAAAYRSCSPDEILHSLETDDGAEAPESGAPADKTDYV